MIYLELQKDKELGRESRFRLHSGGYIELTGKGISSYEGDNRERRRNRTRKFTPYADLAYEVLLRIGKPLHYNEIFKVLENSDSPMNEKCTSQSISNALKREVMERDVPRFHEIAPGTWALSYSVKIKMNRKSEKKEPHVTSEAKEDSLKASFLDFLNLPDED